MILMCVLVPVLLLGVRYCVDLVSYHRALIYGGGSDPYKVSCAKEAALAVAKQWNPGLTFAKQKKSMLYIADSVYNNSPCYKKGSPVHQAIPGLEVKRTSATPGRIYDPLKVVWYTDQEKDIPDASYRNVEYENATGTNGKTSNGFTDIMSLFDVIMKQEKLTYMATVDYIWIVSIDSYNLPSYYIYSSTGSFPYTQRKNLKSDDDKVLVSVENDSIRVIIDKEDFKKPDRGYAVPAECNVDIILSIPTHEGVSPKEIAQAYRTFLANNFEFTRGVNVGLIPYSGKVSLPFGRDDWSRKIDAFDLTEVAATGYIPGCFLYGSRGVKDEPLETGYNNWGNLKIEKRSEAGGGGGRAIMCRGNYGFSTEYGFLTGFGTNFYCVGNLLSTEAPCPESNMTSEEKAAPLNESNKKATLFRRTNDAPCLSGYANIATGKCTQNCGRHYHNPYPVVELMADVGKVKNLLNIILPFHDSKNVSNFIFIPLTWANYLLQDWTSDPTMTNVDTTTADSNTGKLSHPSKKTTGRKKALILVVNKPDRFEPGELTYIGFDGDLFGNPMVEADKIDFSIDYSDTGGRFLDGSAYNTAPNKYGSDPLIAGPKKILTYVTSDGRVARAASGFYETTTANQDCKNRFFFPHKHQVKIVVEGLGFEKGTWSAPGSANTAAGIDENDGNFVGICHDGAKIYTIQTITGVVVTSSDDGVTWAKFGDESAVTAKTASGLSATTTWWSARFYDGQFYTLEKASGTIMYTPDGIEWGKWSPNAGAPLVPPSGSYQNMCYDGNSALYTIHGTTGDLYKFDKSENGWEKIGTAGPTSGNGWQGIDYCNGVLYTVDRSSGKVKISADEGKTWDLKEDLQAVFGGTSWADICHDEDGNMYMYDAALKKIAMMRADSSRCQITSTAAAVTTLNYICYHAGKFYLITNNGNGTLYVFTPTQSTITVKKDATTTVLDSPVVGRKEIYIEPSQISDIKDSNGNYSIEFEMTNIRLISAEIIVPPCGSDQRTAEVPSNSVLMWNGWDKVGSEENRLSPTEAAKRATSAACEKLKSDNPNLRIYVVKYRKKGVDADYAYIDSCASAEGYVYDVNTNYYKKGTAAATVAVATAAANLNTALADIADDIKSADMGGYQAAKNIP
ncbi:MAG: hypothetical protein LBJ96_05370 [Holosporaceae bacterium]|nr:hypothetical protein [Holosporaceae bacterium]